MATSRANSEESSYGLVIAAIIYGIITIAAIYYSIQYKPESALKVQLICGALATIVMLFALPKGRDTAATKLRANYIFVHLVLWAGIIFLPFKNHPLISLAALMLLGIREAGYIAALDAAENKSRSNASKLSMAEIAGRLAILAFALVIVWAILEKTGYDKKVIALYENFVSSLEGENSESYESGAANNGGGEDTSSPIFTASVLQWNNPVAILIDHPFTTSATGHIDLNDTSEDAVNICVSLAKSGNILLLNGTVQSASVSGGKIIGGWRQEKTGASGNYLMTIKGTKVRVVLKYNEANVCVIELE